jgi:hypothetical protein
MSGPFLSADGLGEASRQAFRRLRWEAVARGADRGLWILPGLLLLGVAASFVCKPGSGPVLAGLFVLAGAWALWLARLWFRPPGRRLLARKMDRQAGLPDQALAAAELPASHSPWAELQKRQAAAAYAGRDWKQLWPVPRPRWFWPRLAAALALASACFLPAYLGLRHRQALAAEEAARRASPELQEDLRAVEKLFEEWEKAGAGRQDELQARLMKEVQPLRERLARGELTERQLLVELSKVEESLRAMQESLKSDSVQSFADPLAKAFEPHEGMGALAAALRRESYEQSREEAERLARQLEQGPMALDPQRAKELAEALEKLAEQAREMAEQQQKQGRKGQPQAGQQSPQQMQAGIQPGQPQMPSAGTQQAAGQQASAQQGQPQGQNAQSGQPQAGSNQQALAQALQQLASGLRNGSSPQASGGMRQMAACLGREGGRQMQNGRMAGQMAQLGAGRQGMAQGQGFGQGMGEAPGAQGEGAGQGQGRNPSEAMARSGGGAGNAADEQPFGPATEMGSHASREEVAGQAGEGDSQIQIQHTQEPTFETVASGLEGARFQQYEKLSQEAVGNEALPAAHRQAIRSYFERIRPKNNPETAPSPTKETPP